MFEFEFQLLGGVGGGVIECVVCASQQWSMVVTWTSVVTVP